MAFALVLAGCSSQSASPPGVSASTGPTPTVSAKVAPLEFVEFGDSWIAGEHCGCTTFAGLWAADVEKHTGRPVTVIDHTGARERSSTHEKTTGSLLSTLRNDHETIEEVRNADIVLISDGGNDLPLIGDELIDGSCVKANYACVGQLAALWHRNFDAIVGRIVQLRGGKPTAIRLVNGGNPFFADQDLDALVPYLVASKGGALIAAAAVKAICDAAKKYQAICLDARALLTGPQFDQHYDENAPHTFRVLADALDAKGLPELKSER